MKLFHVVVIFEAREFVLAETEEQAEEYGRERVEWDSIGKTEAYAREIKRIDQVHENSRDAIPAPTDNGEANEDCLTVQEWFDRAAPTQGEKPDV